MITFPGLHLSFSVQPVAFSIGGIPIYWYAILIVMAILFSIVLLKRTEGECGISFQDITDCILYMLPIAFLSARAYYVIFQWNYYQHHLSEIVQIRDGGMAIYGGIIGGVITCLVFCHKRKLKIMDVLDYLAPCLALGQAIGRWGNFFNQEAHGVETAFWGRMGIWENGIYQEVHPTFFYESMGTFFLFLFLMQKMKHRQFSGELTLWYFVFYSFLRFWIEGLRTDSLMLGFVRISQVLSGVIFVVSSTLLVRNIKKQGKMSKNEEKCHTKILQNEKKD